ncbi:hypothetical protein HGRIS_005029 [Hohenbuehelia grisea]|uniref:Uncharacterized protein n=1 Tax=Hohenbuehelia grisea TaxID=104357 RepID=A0ABR3JDQ2_9AGAR
MFSMPSPPEAEMYDGVPVVHLYDDAAELKAFFHVYYNHNFIPFERYNPTFATAMLGPAKMAHKYQVDSLRIVAQIKADWPNDLEAWERRCAEIGPRVAPWPWHVIT